MSPRVRHSAIWLIPLFIIVASLVYHLFVWAITPNRDAQFDFGTQEFVPGKSPHSTGKDSR